jgi:DNA modification methylase
MQTVNYKIADLIEAEYNPRKISKEQLGQLKDSVKRFGFVEPVIVNTNPDRMNIVVSGHQRLKAARALNFTEVPVVELNLTVDQEKELNIRMNKNTGEFDFELLEEYFEADNLVEWGFSDEEVSWGEDEKKVEEDDYTPPPEDEIKTDIVQGDLIEIGRHRLLCGDSTNADDVKNLLNGAEPFLMITDPPYGVNYDASWRQKSGLNGEGTAIGKVENDDKADWSEAWSLSPAKVAYVYHADSKSPEVAKSLTDCDFELRNLIVWAKDNFAISRGHYHHKHEPCWYAVKKNNKANWIGDRSQTTLWAIAKNLKNETGHSTQKPVECMAKPMRNHDGDCYEPFGGSGSTMVAAHQLGRTCYAMEIYPSYCQMHVDRMLKLDPLIKIKINGKEYEAKT